MKYYTSLTQALVSKAVVSPYAIVLSAITHGTAEKLTESELAHYVCYHLSVVMKRSEVFINFFEYKDIEDTHCGYLQFVDTELEPSVQRKRTNQHSK